MKNDSQKNKGSINSYQRNLTKAHTILNKAALRSEKMFYPSKSRRSVKRRRPAKLAKTEFGPTFAASGAQPIVASPSSNRARSRKSSEATMAMTTYANSWMSRE